MSVSKELPEGWKFTPLPGDRPQLSRRDGAAVYWSDSLGAWRYTGPNPTDPFLDAEDGPFAAMELLDREYPMEKQHGD